MQSLTAYQRYQPIINDWPAFCHTLTQPLPTCIWANTLRLSPTKLSDILSAEGIPFTPLPWYSGGFKLAPEFKPGRHWAYLAGLYHSQEEVSMLPVLLLNPQPGERILDMCAAPGNKTAQIAVLMNNQGTVIANDINFGRMKAVRQAQERLGLVNLTTTVYDGANYPKTAGLFDKILVDAPCSCEGTARKDPVVIRRIGPGISLKKSASQKAMLRKAVQLCKPGGLIVYSTCTFAPEENEMVVDAILQSYGTDALRLLPTKLPHFSAAPGLTGWNGHQFDPTLHCAMRVWPHQNDTGGFFVSVIQKLANTHQPPENLPEETFMPPLEPALINSLTERFGIEPVQLQKYQLFQPHQKRAYMVAPHHHPPSAPPPDAIGMVFMKTNIKFPKLSTAAALLLNNDVAKNFIALTDDQVENYHRRQEIQLSAGQSQACTGPGYVLVRYQGAALGVGVFYPTVGDNGILNSLFPKGWSPTAKSSTK